MSKFAAKSLPELLESRMLFSGSVAPQVMGFLPDYEMSGGSKVFAENGSGAITSDTMDWKDLKQVNYFALLPTSTGTLATDPGTGNIETSSGYNPDVQLPALVNDATSHGAKVFVTVGGGDTGKSIPAMNALVNSNQQAWTNFAAQLKTFCAKYGLGGIDLDWEPVSTTSTAIKNFGALVQTIKANDPSLKLSVDVLGDPVAETDNGGQSFTLDALAVKNIDSINVMAYYAAPTEAQTIMTGWTQYVSAGEKDLTNTTVAGRVSQLQYGLEIDSTNQPAGVVEAKVDSTVSHGYGGIFDWTLTEDTGNAVISRIGAQIIKDTQATPPGTGSVSGSIKTSSGTAVPGVKVYVDANNNSKLDSGELSTTTTSTGAYSFSSVPVGAYIIRQVLPAGDTQTTPGNGYGIHITVTNGVNFRNENFLDAVHTTAAAELTGAIIGSTNALNHYASGHGPANAFDNKTSTVFEDTFASDVWLGLDLGKAHKITQIKFAADPANPSFMEGGIFQGSNTANFSSSINLYRVPNTAAPSTSLTTVNISVTSTFRYVRYLPPAGSFGKVAEVEFYGV